MSSLQGPQFILYVWKAFFWLLVVPISLSSSYRPQTNDQTECKIQKVGSYLRSFCSDDQHSWSRFLPWAEYAQNSLRQTTTSLTPFQCTYSVTNLCSSHGRRSHLRLHRWMIDSERARWYGTLHTTTLCMQCGDVLRRRPSGRPSSVPTRQLGKAIDLASLPLPGLQKVESPLHSSLSNPEADQQRHVSAPTPNKVQNSLSLHSVSP